MNDLLAALLLGIIEGITEFLPISSTGHLLIAEHWLGHRSDLFNISIQAGAILAVVLIYRQRLWQLATGFAHKANRDYALKLGLAFGVTAVLGVLVKKLGFELPETIAPVAWALLLGGFVILGVEAIDARRPDLPDDDPDAIGWGTAVLVGLAQVLAGVFPGTSRSAAAIFAALLFGKSTRLAATEFAFLVGIPTMFAATGYELVDMLRDGSAASEDWTALAVAFVASAITAFVAVKWLLRYIQTHRFTIFAWYRIAFGAALLAWLYFGSAASTAATAVAPAPEAREATRAIAPATPAATATSPFPARWEEVASAAGDALPAPEPAASGRSEADTAVLREFAVRKFCTETMDLQAYVADPRNAAFFDSLAQVRGPASRKTISDLQQRLDELDEAERACRGLEPQLLDGSSYDAALRAAELGDSQAAQCFVAGSFPMPPALHRQPDVLTRYRLDAARVIERGIGRGDWNMVTAAAFAYAPRAQAQAPSFEPPLYLPGLMLLGTVGGPAGDVERAYGLMRLMELGADSPETAESYRRNAEEYAARLAPEKRRARDAWARQAFRGQFGRRRMQPDDTTYCEASL